METTEWALLTPPFERLVEGGDSGAWCFTTTATGGKNEVRVVGMVFGASTDLSVAYVTPMNVLFEDVRERTGKCVRLPVPLEL
jgi:hypothetical protein